VVGVWWCLLLVLIVLFVGGVSCLFCLVVGGCLLVGVCGVCCSFCLLVGGCLLVGVWWCLLLVLFDCRWLFVGCVCC